MSINLYIHPIKMSLVTDLLLWTVVGWTGLLWILPFAAFDNGEFVGGRSRYIGGAQFIWLILLFVFLPYSWIAFYIFLGLLITFWLVGFARLTYFNDERRPMRKMKLKSSGVNL